MVALSLETARAAHYARAVVLAGTGIHARGAWNRRILHIKFEIAGNEEIQPSIAIVVAKRCSGGPSTERNASILRYIA